MKRTSVNHQEPPGPPGTTKNYQRSPVQLETTRSTGNHQTTRNHQESPEIIRTTRNHQEPPGPPGTTRSHHRSPGPPGLPGPAEPQGPSGTTTPQKKVSDIPVPSRDVTYQTLRGRESFPPRVSLLSDYLPHFQTVVMATLAKRKRTKASIMVFSSISKRSDDSKQIIF
jgi:hypothetical protein